MAQGGEMKLREVTLVRVPMPTPKNSFFSMCKGCYLYHICDMSKLENRKELKCTVGGKEYHWKLKTKGAK